MSLQPGVRLGLYEIVSLIGEGGMGQVFRARDSKLAREVAIKILPPNFAQDPERLARFEREARALAALNHPNIAHIHGMESHEHVHALVMELVDGEDLSARIARGPVPVDETIAAAQQIAEALEAAHEHGIVHRDLKPANIKIRDDAVVKLLDFGLAKAWTHENPGGDATNSPTLTARATQLGTILGTAAYMAPEQARGKTVDRRADIWAYGVVLFEMLTATRAFPGDDVTDVLAKVIEREPDLSKLPASTPPTLRRLIARCLIKDPKLRLRDIGEARLALVEAQQELAASAAPTRADVARAATVPLWRRGLPWAAVLGIIVVAVALRPRPAAIAAPLMRLQLALPPGVEIFSAVGAALTVSPDGSMFAFVGVRQGVREVYLRRLDSYDITPVRGTETAVSCVFSPDGRELLVGMSDTSLRRVRLSDGLVQVITSSTSVYFGGWLSNNRAVFSKDGRLWMTDATPGATPVQLTEAQPDATSIDVQSVPVPGRDAILFTSGRPEAADQARIESLSLPDRVRKTVIERATNPLVTAGRLLFVRDRVVFSVPFDAGTLAITGDPTPLLRDVNIVQNRGISPILSVSDTGVLVYSSASSVQSEIVSVSRQGAERTLLTLDMPIMNPRIAGAGRWLILEQLGSGLWVQDRERGALSRLTEAVEAAGFPILGPDGLTAVYRTLPGMSTVRVDGGGGKATAIEGSSDSEFPSAITPDGKELLYTKLSATTAGDLYVLPLAGGKPRVLLSTPAYEGGADISPDGRWIVYVSNERGTSEIYLQPYPAMDRRIQVSTSGGIHPRWNPKGGEIFYRNGDRMMSVRMTTTAAGPSLSEPVALFSGRYAFGGGLTIPNYAITADGNFILVKERSGATLNVVLNWLSSVDRGAK